MKRGECCKCKKIKLLQKHHPLTRKEFKEDYAAMEYTEEICGSCHDEYGQFLRKTEIQGNNYNDYLIAWYYWLYGLIIIGIGLFLILQ